MTEIERLKQRIAALEAEIERLKAGPREVHYHYHNEPVSPMWPRLPEPTTIEPFKLPEWPTVICAANHEAMKLGN